MTLTTTTFPTCPARISDDQVQQFRREGFIAFTEVLSATEVEAARTALSDLVTRMAEDESRVQNGTHWTLPGERFVIGFEKGFVPDGIEADLELKVRKLMWFQNHHPHLHYLAQEQPRLRGVLEGLIGGDPILFQDTALIKPPFIGREKPWHQDNAYFAVTPLEAVCGVWIALDEATVENGCMHMLRGGNKPALKHYHGRDCEIVPDRLQDANDIVPIPLPAGGALFFSGMVPHFTPENHSPLRRRALQFHYRSQDSRIVNPQEYDKVYAEPDGTPASCRAASRNGL